MSLSASPARGCVSVCCEASLVWRRAAPASHHAVLTTPFVVVVAAGAVAVRTALFELTGAGVPSRETKSYVGAALAVLSVNLVRPAAAQAHIGEGPAFQVALLLRLCQVSSSPFACPGVAAAQLWRALWLSAAAHACLLAPPASRPILPRR